MRHIVLLGAFVLGLAMAAPDPAAAAGEVNLYSARQPFLINPLLERFTQETGIRVNVVFDENAILQRLKAEGANSPADAVLTVDIGNLNDLDEAGLLQTVKSATLEANIPAQFRHPEGHWFGLTTRARVFMVSKDRVKPGEIATYADLADPKWKGRICTRSGKHSYNVGLIASVIAHEGEAKAKDWLEAVKANLARKPQGNDRSQAKAVMEGICDVALANTYYMGAMMTNEKEPEQKEWAASVRIVFPGHGNGLTHVNISGAAVTKAARRRDNAVRLIEFLSGDEAQQIYAKANFEYPVKAGVTIDPMVKAWGELRPDTLPLVEIARDRVRATRLVDTVRFDQGPGGS